MDGTGQGPVLELGSERLARAFPVMLFRLQPEQRVLGLLMPRLQREGLLGKSQFSATSIPPLHSRPLTLPLSKR